MSPQAKISDEAIKQYLGLGMSQAEIARMFHISEAAISKRVKRMERAAAPQSLAVVVEAQSSVWDVRQATEDNYNRCLQLLEQMQEPGEKLKAISEIRQHLAHAMQVLQALYTVQEVRAFQEEVLTILDECEPGLRDTILTRLRQRRVIRTVVSGL